MQRKPRYPQCARITSAVQGVVGVDADGFYGKHTEQAVKTALAHYDGNTAAELLEYLSDYDHIAVEKAPEERRPAVDIIEETPSWLREAFKDRGIAEIKGRQHNNRIIELFKKAFLPFRTDETPWCAAAVCAWLESVGIRSTRSGLAKDFLYWGKSLTAPKRGAIVVFNRGNPNSYSGHVALCTENNYIVKDNGRTYVPVFGGNQGDQACHKDYPASKLCHNKHGELVAFRWPEAV